MKKLILWDYERGMWQYDLFCLLIVAFIFLTPKTWFDSKGKMATQTANSAVKAQGFSQDLAKSDNNTSKAQISPR